VNDPEKSREAWEEVRREGRWTFHIVVTLATTAVCVVGEAIGNLAFRRGHRLFDGLVDAAIFGVLAGTFLAWWLWKKQEK